MAHISFAHFLVHTGHEFLKLCCIFIADGRLIVDVIFILKYLRENVGNGLSFRVAHELVLQSVALAVTHDDEMNLPQPQIIQELVTIIAYLAHD